MQTSVRSEALRPADLKAFSDESVHISREVSIVSSRAPTPSNIPSTINGHVPTEFAPGIASATGPGSQLNRWNSKVSDMSRRYSRRTSSLAPRTSQDAALLNSNRESMKALSDFLMTREPPPNNFMSIPSDDEKSLTSLKRSAFNFFGKQRKKTTKQPRLMQLPDSAVAAQTRSGARHIAISIPMEHNQSRGPNSLQPPNPLRSHPPTKPDRGAITVLKSVAEGGPDRQSKDGIRDGGDGRRNAESRSNGGTRSLDASVIMNAYHLDEDESPRQSRVAQHPMSHDPQRSQKSYVAVSPTELNQLDSQLPDLRNSGGTMYSQMSFASTRMGHSRNISSISTAPSATVFTSLQLDLPPRTSSIPKVSKALQKELAIASNLANERAAEGPRASPTKDCGSAGTSPSPPAVYGIAVRGYNASPVGRPQVVKNMTSKSHVSYASSDLPSPPEGQTGFISRPSTAPPARTRNLKVPRSKETVRRTASSRDGTTESILVTRQSRQERVKARKLRDIESVRSQSSPRRPLSESRATSISQNPSPVVAPPRNPKRGEARRRATINTLSPIMLVANLPPYTGYVTKSDLSLQRPSREARSVAPNSPESTVRSAHTPPRSIVTSFDSDTESALPISPNSKRRSPTQSLRSSVLETRRQERRAKRNMSLREREMDARMSKIESDNKMLLQTLGTIARSIGEISRIGKESRKEGRIARLLDEERKLSPEEKRRRVELEKMEPVMREMQGMAPSVSMEIHKVRSGNGEDEDSDDAMSILG
ncbi:hypothetical protein BKA65DRAFT_28137 [Rhexocercosporidium sp. MPI-PUGE-AT-0058]|nr:hypothetical protein BKA65DRAFT_28137 [Rhexocercosporidium sp. MPI-PUGE-AT-0058]